MASDISTNDLFVPHNDSIGRPECECPYCGALFWRAESIKRTSKRQFPEFGACCKNGMIKLPLLKTPPPFLDSLLNDNEFVESKKFRERIRIYNSVFAFTSAGGRIDYDINKKPGPYVFRICGQNHHVIGSLLPDDGQRPKFAQLYVFDTTNEIANRLSCIEHQSNSTSIDQTIIHRLIQMLDHHNEIAKSFRMARDRFSEDSLVPIKLKLVGRRETDTSQYTAPVASEIAGLLVGDFGYYDKNRDIVVEYKTGTLRRISSLHPSFMAMQFPMLFPYGESGYMVDIKYSPTTSPKKIKCQYVTMREYYAYYIQQRALDKSALLRGGRLFQQFIVDAFTCIEQERLDFIKRNQTALRSEIYTGIRDAFYRGDTNSTDIGKSVILPASYTGSPRYMMEHYHDAMTICRFYGHPDLFVTFTCNPAWVEIQQMLTVIEGQKVEDRPDIVARVFKFKVDQFSKDIKGGKYFGPVSAFLYTVEFQKRGLPHVHCLIWLPREKKPLTVNEIDTFISAELPDPITDPLSHALVTKFMIHGPCGALNEKCPCMRGEMMGLFFEKNGIKLDNRFVVPYNPKLLTDFVAHLNVEFCCYSSLVKYLFKYISKGSDRIRAVLETDNAPNLSSPTNVEHRDEVKNFLDCRYISPCEAAWRIFEFPIHHREPAVERLVVHLPNMNSIFFNGQVGIRQLYQNEAIKKTMLTEWFEANLTFPDARTLTYAEFPTKWTWNSKDKLWSKRKRGRSIGRLTYVHPNAGELYYLRMLLNLVRGPRNFEELKTINGIQYLTFQATCMAYGLLGDDKEWMHVLEESVL
ncbi:uncharacterized protein LOC126675026 [Mercurialis annua]|uniref:uncharacterized protein LOC126675026 n=1 Tax=Mercurialis annua TaxID=3986 RepID=UPI00215E16F6|nr:uncharacterized protein LOC126675026 [Mercurialis annua]